ncbi:hypothetical protein ACIRYZ_38775 [Kitasatospora sp. NPDC101155]|uniref:hypothetical protein n=1 Tax=Kitasatospora sp. NPDC101155 TaxID=3364097 RepID=UPI003801422F
MSNTTAARFAASYALLRASAAVADHWVQSTHQAACKGFHDGETVTETRALADGTTVKEARDVTSAEGRWACAAHVATYTATQGLALAVGSKVLGLRLRPGAVAAALVVSGLTHYVADRRRPLKKLAELVGKAPFYNVNSGGMNGAYALDQSYHHLFETVAAAVAAR